MLGGWEKSDGKCVQNTMWLSWTLVLQACWYQHVVCVLPIPYLVTWVFSTCWRVVSWISWSAGGQLVWCLYSRFLHICAKMHYGGAPWKRFEFVCLDTGYGVLWCPVFKFHVELWFQTWLVQGTNCRMYHTFVDEDAMRWLKGVLDVQLLLPVGGMSCFFQKHYNVLCQGVAAKAHPRRRHLWLLKCAKLRPSAS